MKFEVIAQVTSKKTGIDLDDEYDRLGFEKRPEKFPMKQVTIEVSKEFAKENRELFGNGMTAYIQIDSEKTEAQDWEDWGSAGSMLSTERMDIERVMSLK
jgi:hypothetical protein